MGIGVRIGIFDQNDRGLQPLREQYRERLELAEFYDRNGFYCYHTSEHHSTPLSTAPSPGIFLSALAQRTTRILLGPLVYLLPLYHPLRLAEEVCMLDHLSGGRFQLGVGRGASPHELAYLGVNIADAQDMYVEALDVMLKAFGSEQLDHAGKHWRFDGVPIEMKPLQRPHPPLWYAVGAPESVSWPARNDVHVVCAGPASRVGEITSRYREELRGLGQTLPDDRCLGLNRYVVVGRTDGEAVDRGRRAWPLFHHHFWKLWKRHGTEPRTLKLPAEFDALLASGAAVAGSPATVRDALQAQIDEAGVTYFIGSFTFGSMSFADTLASLELFTEGVMPALRRAERD